MGPLAQGETTLAAELLGQRGAPGAGMLLLADRLFTGAELLWRTRSIAVLPVLKAFADGSYLSQISAATDRRGRIAPTVVGVVEYTLGDPGRPQATGQTYRLLTTILGTPPLGPPPSWRRCTTSAGRPKGCWTSSRPTSAARGWCCAPIPPRWSPRRSGRCCWFIGPSARSCTRPPWTARRWTRPAVVCPLLAGGSPPGHRPGRVSP
jgi:hypothetical protein